MVWFAALGVCLILVSGCNSTFRRIVTPITSTIGDPQPNKTAIFLSQDPSVPGTVSLVDVSGDTLIGTRTVGTMPIFEGLTVNGGRVFVVNQGSDSVSSFQTATVASSLLVNSSLPLGSAPSFVVSNENAKIWIAETGSDKVALIDGSLTAVAQIDVNAAAGCTQPGPMSQQLNGKLYVGCKGSNRAVVINNTDNAVLSGAGGIPLNGSPVWMDVSTSGRYVFVAEGSGVMEVIDTMCDAVQQTVSLSGTPTYLTYNVGSGRVFVVSSGAIDVINTSQAPPATCTPPAPLFPVTSVTAHINGATGVTALADGTRFYVSNSGTDSYTDPNPPNALLQFFGYVSVYSIAGGLWEKDIQVGDLTSFANSNPQWIASSADSSKVFTANSGSFDFGVIGTSFDTNITNIPSAKADPSCIDPPLPGAPCARVKPIQVAVTP